MPDSRRGFVWAFSRPPSRCTLFAFALDAVKVVPGDHLHARVDTGWQTAMVTRNSIFILNHSFSNVNKMQFYTPLSLTTMHVKSG